LYLADFFEKEFPMPTMAQVQHDIPSRFQKYMDEFGMSGAKIKNIIDASEIVMESSTDPRVKRTQWSQYKHRTTGKTFGDITPQGAFNFVPKEFMFGGRIVDGELVEACGWLEMLKHLKDEDPSSVEGAICMADRGFLIQHRLAELGLRIMHPEKRARKADDINADTAEMTSTIARLRIHVERAFARVKQFKFFDRTMKISQADILGKIWYVCCMLTHYMPPLVTEKMGRCDATEWRKRGGQEGGGEGQGEGESESEGEGEQGAGADGSIDMTGDEDEDDIDSGDDIAIDS
jgi:hypothetical protein